MRRALQAVVVFLVFFVAPVSAEHSPHYDVACPAGSASIVLDPGHGGADPGAVNDEFGLYERDLNLEIATRVAELLKDAGYSVVLTRDDNETELANSERGEIANACAAAVLVEIHLNAAEDPEINYSHVFWGEKEKDLALTLLMRQALVPLNIPAHEIDRFDNGGLLRAKMPSVLVEAVFLSNPEEARQLASGTRQEEIAQAITNGIISWMELTAQISAGQIG
jgi:N-acetylmuramoyl-L-alanine amidase